MNINAKRLEGETCEHYKERMKSEKRRLKAYLNGRRVKYTKKEIKDIIGAMTNPEPTPIGD